MKLKSLTFVILIAIFIIPSILSCSTDKIENELMDTYIDLSLVSENDWEMSEDILYLLNEYRASIGLSTLNKDNSYASAYAVKHSKYMIDQQDISHEYFAIRSNGLKEKGAIRVKENVAYGYSSAESVVRAWLKSNGHREAIEGDFTHIGFGVIKSDDNRYYYTTIFYK